jgi:hypothetical protein
VTFLLRQNFSDIHVFEDPNKVAEAKGASFSWTDDRVAEDRIWSVNGMVALAYTIGGSFADQPGQVSLLGASFVPYAQLNRETHSKLTKKNSQIETYGASLEFGLDIGGSGEKYFNQQFWRISASSVNDVAKNKEIAHVSAEWIPIYRFTDNFCIGLSCGLIPVSQLGAGPQIIYKLNPEIRTLYDRAQDDGDHIFFSNEEDAIRIGPEVTLLMKLFGPGLVIWEDYFDLSKFLFKTTYSWDYETNSGRDFSWLDTSLTYNLGKSGHLGLTASYQNGYSQDVGERTEVGKLSLTGKY